jgi:hypothetical protein
MTETNYANVAEELVGRIDKLRKKIGRIDERRAVLPLDAHIGDATARKEMDKLGDERNAKLGEISDLDAALAEARRRMGEAKTAEAAEAECKRAEQALPIARRIAEVGEQQDAAARRYVELHAEAEDLFNQLTALGVPTASRELRRVNRHRQHDATFASLDKVARPVPPGQRSSFASLYRGWAAMSLNWINQKLYAAKVAA